MLMQQDILLQPLFHDPSLLLESSARASQTARVYQ